MADYSDKFARALWTYLESHANLVPDNADCDRSGAQRAKVLQRLYGAAVLPDDLLAVCNHGVSQPNHICPALSDKLAVCRQFYKVLFKYCILVEEKPTSSRFWTFGASVNSLVRMRLLGLPDAIFQTGTMQPPAENQKRLKALALPLPLRPVGPAVAVAVGMKTQGGQSPHTAKGGEFPFQLTNSSVRNCW